MANSYTTRTVETTEALGERIGRELGPGGLVCLTGELGAGKTALVRGLARGLGVAEVPSSPSFALMNEYVGRVPLYHFDAWMRGREAALLSEGADELLEGRGVAVVEWSDQVAELLPTPHLRVSLRHLGPSERSVSLEVVAGPERSSGERLERLQRALESAGKTPGLAPEVARREGG